MCITWQNQLRANARPEKIKIFMSFFKTEKGEYGEGDKFIGINVPDNRKISRQHSSDPIEHIREMLYHEIHEFRLAALIALSHRYEKSNDTTARLDIVRFYLQHCHQCNNWDLVDLSAPAILGSHLLHHDDHSVLDTLSLSDNLWHQRIAIVATLTLIRNNRFDDTMRLARQYLSHPHPLIHKATGWMLREVGKKDESQLLGFLDRHCHEMPRTALRYAIERLSTEKRKYYMEISKNCK